MSVVRHLSFLKGNRELLTGENFELFVFLVSLVPLVPLCFLYLSFLTRPNVALNTIYGRFLVLNTRYYLKKPISLVGEEIYLKT
ncbi:hypothetical protein NIES2100_75540 [Calothrix sp. NIES-2100]|nr:hypothetical protein NIES2100_75540 [Calothrix sp. NIES-2100]